MTRRNIFIYGSCVSRDAFDPLPENHKIISYVARQSLISAMSAPTSLLPGNPLASSFQNRMLDGDIDSNLLPKIREHRKDIDVLLIDLTDERLGVHKLPDKAFVTRSNELVISKRLDNLDPIPGTIRLGSERHTMFWVRAAERFYRQLDAMGLRDRTVVINTPWATRTTEGSEVPPFRGVPTSEANLHLGRLADVVRGLGFKVADLPHELAVSTSAHKWGVDPFHYAPPVMDWIRQQVDAIPATQT